MDAKYQEFKNELSRFIKSNHDDATKESLKADLKQIFDSFGVNDSVFSVITFELGSRDITAKNASAYIDKIAGKILQKQSAKKDKIKGLEQEQGKRKDGEQKKTQNSKKRALSFDVAEIGDLPLDSLRGFMAHKLKLAGFSEDELNKPIEAFDIYDLNSQSVNLNVSGGTIVDQLAEVAKKFYIMFVNGKTLDEVKNLTLTELEVQAKKEDNTVCYTTDSGEHIHNSLKSLVESDIDISLNADGSKNFDVDMEDPLTGFDKHEIKKYNLSNITTHGEMVEFRKSDHYQQIRESEELAKAENDLA